jgi:hypothetical protein
MAPRRRALLHAALALPVAAAGAARAQSIEVLTLRWRSADELLPLLQPFVESGGALTGRGNQLILRASPANRRQIEELLARLDTAPRQLVITVSQDRADDSAQRALGADGSVTITTRRSSGALTVEGSNARSTGARAATQTIRVLEGGRATIAFGTAIPFKFRQWTPTAQGLTELRGTTWFEAVTGFAVRPRLSGDLVTLELSPQDDQFTGSGAERMHLMTTVQGRLGEWIALGGADLRSESNERGIASYDERSAASRRGVWVRVEEAGR